MMQFLYLSFPGLGRRALMKKYCQISLTYDCTMVQYAAFPGILIFGFLVLTHFKSLKFITVSQ